MKINTSHFVCIYLIIIYIAVNMISCGVLSSTSQYDTIPKFPWPPPEASARVVINSTYLLNQHNDTTYFKDVDNKISAALDANGYVEKSYYSVPDGFAIVTRLEQYNEDGTILNSAKRWNSEYYIMSEGFSFGSLFKLLYTANPGYYRFIVFIITPHPFSHSGAKPSESDVESWLSNGVLWLPPKLGAMPFTDSYYCTALIYEYEHYKYQEEAILVLPSRLAGNVHLEKNYILPYLEGK
jgi:hypothetical protein